MNSTRILQSELDNNNEMYSARFIKSGLEYNSEWQKTIDDNKVQAKEYWKKNQNKLIRPAPFFTDLEKENAKALFVPTYRISYSSLLKWDTLTPVQDMMTLCLDTAVFYVFPNRSNSWQFHFAFNEGNLNIIRCFGLLVYFDDINELYFKKHLTFFNVDIVNDRGYRITHYVVFINEKGELMSIRLKEIIPLKQVLRRLITNPDC